MIKSKFIHEYNFKEFVFLFNTITFDYHILDKISSKKWKEGKFSTISLNEKEELVKKRFLINNKVEDENLFQKAINYFSNKNIKIQLPSFLIYITNECNLSCSYCFQINQRKNNSLNLTKEKVNSIFYGIDNIIKNFHNNSDMRITIFGGEPLLIKNKNIIEYLFTKL
ncbi:MAG: 4Fe-4S cluster-binding domain-containing protein [Exilispira sp.]|jgi:sulfatase maturation enzyme AslB (radical SAM superfamily)|nr:4Fe-4S cluster-binding domain-containing protein [Exilispira sp.]